MTTNLAVPPYVEHAVTQKMPFLYLNERWQPLACVSSELSLADVQAAGRRLDRFARLLTRCFPELETSGGIIESPLYRADRLQQSLAPSTDRAGRWLIKADHELAVAGSIKARGGIYEVLLHAEQLAIQEGMLMPQDDPQVLAAPRPRALFAQHEVVVGSTGNLGLSIGITAAALGFRATVHMSADAKAWKKERLRARGVEVIEHEGDFGAAVAAGRERAARKTNAYFIDDENSRHLFLGYSVAALRLERQLTRDRIRVDRDHPLFVYLPCGVGGAPGGITFGLRHLFGDHVHCFFAEPVASPSMLIRLASSIDEALSVRALGLDNATEADGLAVAQASEFVAPLMRPLVSGIFTVRDDDLFEDLYLLRKTEGFRIEPSAAAAFRGPRWVVDTEVGHQYLVRHDLSNQMRCATHILWTTGGAFLPDDDYRRFYERGENSVRETVID